MDGVSKEDDDVKVKVLTDSSSYSAAVYKNTNG